MSNVKGSGKITNIDYIFLKYVLYVAHLDIYMNVLKKNIAHKNIWDIIFIEKGDPGGYIGNWTQINWIARTIKYIFDKVKFLFYEGKNNYNRGLWAHILAKNRIHCNCHCLLSSQYQMALFQAINTVIMNTS